MENESSKATRLRILFVAPSFDILGGQSVQAARLMDRLREEPSLEIGFLPINPRLPGILRKLQSIKYIRTVVTSVAYIASLLLRVYKFDVIHVFSASYFSFVIAPTPAILIGKLYGRKVLLNYHSGEAEDHLHRWRRTCIPTIRLADSVVVPSEYLVRVFAMFGLKAHAIYNLIDIRHFRFRERVPLRPVFLSNRNLERHYGVDRVLRAFGIVQQSVPDARLTIAGDGSQRRALEKLAQELQLRNTSFIGQVDPGSIADVYDAADIFLNGSEIDNQPLSILEAFSCGLPVVTTDAGGIPDIVADGNSGMVVPRGDYMQMAERALQLLNDPVLATQLIKRGRDECSKYSWEAVRDAWLSAYDQLRNQNERTTADEAQIQSQPTPENKVLSR
jgi:glycosyltransferase involved in cell wall biosynthesis